MRLGGGWRFHLSKFYLLLLNKAERRFFAIAFSIVVRGIALTMKLRGAKELSRRAGCVISMGGGGAAKVYIGNRNGIVFEVFIIPRGGGILRLEGTSEGRVCV